jgi:hypothetical protein
MIGCGLLVASGRTLAGNLSFKGEIISEFIYHQLNGGIPTLQKPYLETESNTSLKLDLLGFAGSYQYELQATGYFHEFLFGMNRATISGFSGPVLWEFGKKDWTFGKGLAFIPNYPLTQGADCWGFENSIILSPYSLVTGVARERSKVGAGWLRAGKMRETSDWGVVLSYIWDDGCNYWQGGAEFSWDFLNGLSVHGGASIELPEQTGKYLLGGVYSGGRLNYILEYYYAENHYLFAGLSREPGLFGRWQWGVKEIYSLNDAGLISIINLKYLGNNTVTPELIITNFGGGNSNERQNNPVKWEYIMRLTANF